MPGSASSTSSSPSLLYGRWGVLGLGAAFALSYAMAALWALSVLATKVRGYPLRRILESIARVLLAGALAGEAAWWVARRVGGNTGADALLRIVAGSDDRSWSTPSCCSSSPHPSSRRCAGSAARRVGGAASTS